jgi:hypothetical protein
MLHYNNFRVFGLSGDGGLVINLAAGQFVRQVTLTDGLQRNHLAETLRQIQHLDHWEILHQPESPLN